METCQAAILWNKQSESKLEKNNRNTIAAKSTQSTTANHNSAVDSSTSRLEGSISGRMDFSSRRSMTAECVESWLDTHPEFVAHYFTRRATKSMVDEWLVTHAQCKSSPEATRSDVSSSGSGSTTPARKISAQEFEKDGQMLKSMISTIDGQKTFIGSPPIEHHKRQRRKRDELKSHDERELMYELVMDICNDLDVTSLCHKILQNVSILLNADRCSMFLVQGEEGSKTLVSRLFDVNCNSTMEECTGICDGIRVSWGCGIAGTVAETGKTLNIPDAYGVRLLRYKSLLRDNVIAIYWVS